MQASFQSKLNQIGSVSETLEAIKMAHNAGYTANTGGNAGVCYLLTYVGKEI